MDKWTDRLTYIRQDKRGNIKVAPVELVVPLITDKGIFLYSILKLYTIKSTFFSMVQNIMEKEKIRILKWIILYLFKKKTSPYLFRLKFTYILTYIQYVFDTCRRFIHLFMPMITIYSYIQAYTNHLHICGWN